ncbi:hypothetical protein [Mesorhizobium silamurunense]|uniref:hypothetical protein n=1 Tax=Mesorhizobium silamurunense TaxID=499528 RepID=UPI00177D82B4|nr:hypothetical protein [Mesorhizobium silamurunense]
MTHTAEDMHEDVVDRHEDPVAALQIVGEIGKIALQPGDVLVVSCPMAISIATRDLIAETIARVFPGYSSLLLSDGAKLEVARQKQGGRSETAVEIARRLAKAGAQTLDIVERS